NTPKIAHAYGLATTCPFFGYESIKHPNTHFPAHDDLEGAFEPFIDWTYQTDRALFGREINAAKQVLRNTRNISAIILIGFRGYYNPADPADPWNEEMVPVLESLIARGFKNVFMAVHHNQAAKLGEATSRLMKD